MSDEQHESWIDRHERRVEPRRIRVAAMHAAAAGEVSVSDEYAEIYWLPVLGPASLLLHRRLCRMVGEVTTDLFLARAVGLGQPHQGRWSAFGRTMGRLESFGWIRPDPYDGITLLVRTRLPYLGPKDERKLPPELYGQHQALLRALMEAEEAEGKCKK